VGRFCRENVQCILGEFESIITSPLYSMRKSFKAMPNGYMCEI